MDREASPRSVVAGPSIQKRFADEIARGWEVVKLRGGHYNLERGGHKVNIAATPSDYHADDNAKSYASKCERGICQCRGDVEDLNPAPSVNLMPDSTGAPQPGRPYRINGVDYSIGEIVDPYVDLIDPETGEVTTFNFRERTSSWREVTALTPSADFSAQKPRTIYRGLRLEALEDPEDDIRIFAQMNPTQVIEEVKRYLQGDQYGGMRAGVHWSASPSVAFNFASDRDVWGYRTDYGDETPVLGLVLKGEIDPGYVIGEDDDDWEVEMEDRMAFGESGSEEEVMPRDGSPIRLVEAEFIIDGGEYDMQSVAFARLDSMQVTAAADDWMEAFAPNFPGETWKPAIDPEEEARRQAERDARPHPNAYWHEQDEPDSRMRYAEQVPIDVLLPALEWDRSPDAPKLDWPGGEPLAQGADQDYWDILKADIAKKGILSPIYLDYNAETGEAHVSEGNHRIKAAQELGLTSVPVIVYPSRRRSQGGSIKLQPGQHHGEYGKPSAYGLPVEGTKMAMAADPDFIQQWIEENGPHLYHGVSNRDGLSDEEFARVVERIRREGLKPNQRVVDPGPMPTPPAGLKPDWSNYDYVEDENWRMEHDEWFHSPRPNHVFMTARPEDAYGPHVFRIDLRKLDPAKLKADEDWYRDEIGWDYDLDKPRTMGQQAEEIGLGDDPEHTHRSLQENYQSVAHEGPIPPEAISYVEPGDADDAWHAQTPWQYLQRERS